MADAAKKHDARGELEALAEAIASEVGASESGRDSALAVLAKGMSDAVNNLIPLVKGTTVPLKNEGGAGPEEASGHTDNDDYDQEANVDKDKLDDEPGEDYDDEYKGGGYEDMRMGGGGGEEFVDATEFLAAMHRENRELRRMVKGLTKEVSALTKFVRERDAALRTDMGNTLAAMAKGTVGLHQLLLDTPIVPVRDPGLAAKHRLLKDSLDQQLGGSEIKLEQMVKALQTGIIDEDQYRTWKRDGSFPVEDQATLITQIKAL